MKEQSRKNQSEEIKEYMDAVGLTSDDDSSLGEVPSPTQGKSRVNAMRRRTEERLESKRIDLEYSWDDLDDGDDSLQ
ncbi:MAG: hypothetical protein ACR2PR_01900 [Pseudohongiellaceae bacterium]